jgi:protein-S-isoprenylcysteine O-methyltransferase Ste14
VVGARGDRARVLAVVLDVTVLSVALPTLATDLHASTSDLVVSAGIALAGLVLALAFLPRRTATAVATSEGARTTRDGVEGQAAAVP